MKCVYTSSEDSSVLGCDTAPVQVVSEIHKRVWNYAPTDSVLSLPKIWIVRTSNILCSVVTTNSAHD